MEQTLLPTRPRTEPSCRLTPEDSGPQPPFQIPEVKLAKPIPEDKAQPKPTPIAEYDEFSWEKGDIRYDIEEKIDDEGMGTVWLAKDRRFDRKVAIKTLDPLKKPGLLELEAKVMARLPKTEDTVQVYDFYKCPENIPGFCDAGTPLIIMEYIDQPTLYKFSADRGKIELEEITKIVQSLATTLDFMAADGIVHRDLSPGNIFINQNPSNDSWLTKIADFGFSRHYFEKDLAMKNTLIEKSGKAAGTLSYIAPEVCQANTHGDLRSTVWALGMISWEMFAGRRMFDGLINTYVAKAIIENPAKRIADLAKKPANLSDGQITALDEVFEKALAKDPDDRYQTATEFSQALTQALETNPDGQENRTLEEPVGVSDARVGKPSAIAIPGLNSESNQAPA